MPGRKPPQTEEGWFVSHLVLSINRRDASQDNADLSSLAEQSASVLEPASEKQQIDLGRIVSSKGDLMTMMFTETMEEVEAFQRDLLNSSLGPYLEREYTFLSVTELSFYRSTEEKVEDYLDDENVEPGTETYQQREQELKQRFKKYEDMRLHPKIPDMDYLTFYPMKKRRNVKQNWYQLPADKRGKLMQAHGATGRKYAGDIKQIITSCVGLDEWEWGVTLYGDDARDFKRLIYEMRFDEVSAVYSDFGPFYTGLRIDPEALPDYVS